MVVIILYMLLVIISADLCFLLQMIGGLTIETSSGVISFPDSLMFSYVMYFIGLILYFTLCHILYQKLVKKHLEITVLSGRKKLFIFIMAIIGCALLFYSFMVLALDLSFTPFMNNSTLPGNLGLVTFYGWPIITTGYVLVRLSLDM